jgi:hypothetical protein
MRPSSPDTKPEAPHGDVTAASAAVGGRNREEWAAQTVKDAQNRGERLPQRKFEQLALAERKDVKRDAARDLYKQWAPADWQVRGRPRKKMREK